MFAVPASLLPALKGFVGALAALLLVALAVSVFHLYQDHLVFHQLVSVLNTLATKHPDLFK
jgi:hypothetical protein